MLDRRGDLMDLERAFARAMTCARGPWWRRLLHKPAKTLIYEAALRLPRGVPFARPVSARTFFGEEMRVVLPEESACQLWYYGFIEEDVTAFLLTYVREGMTVIDVGAHSGYFTLLASALVQPSGWVHAFEPARRTCARLRHNTRRHRNVTVQQQALWSSRTTRPFHEYGERYSTLNSVSNHRLIQEIGRVRQRSYDVECLSLDEYCTAAGIAPDFIKIDAETAEPQILRGSVHTLVRHRPIIAIEVWDDPARHSRDDITFLLNHGYEAFEYHMGAILPHHLRDGYEYTNLLFSHPSAAKVLGRGPRRRRPLAE
jgi:FkbM family methyltransferase